jgi:hypothetical protein
MDGPWSKSTYYLSDDEGSDIVDMSEVHVAGPSKEAQDAEWDSFQLASPSDEPLDWGSDFEDPESCVLLSSPSHNVHEPTVLPQPLRRPSSLMDGSFKYACPLNVHNLSDHVCEHQNNYVLCVKCKGKRPLNKGALWLLDSGASAHFTFDKNDFIEYEPATPDERTAVRTVFNTIYIEGKGAALVNHMQGDEMVQTRLYPVLYIPKITTRLLSMGDFLQQGMHVSGNAHNISLFYRKNCIITCKPLIDGQTIYWLDASI